MQENIFKIALSSFYEEESSLWENLRLSLSKVLNQNIESFILRDFIEEDNISEEGNFQLVFTDPDTSIKLIDKGYKIIAKLKNHEEYICSISLKDYSTHKDVIKIALINRKFFLLPLLFYKEDFKKFNLIFAKNYNEVLELIKNKKADIGFVYHSKINDKLEKEFLINYNENFCFNVNRYLLIHPSLEQYTEQILTLKDFERVTEIEVETLKSLFNQLEKMLKDWANSDITEALINFPNLGILIYDEKIVYVNKYAIELLGYEKEELFKMKSLDLVYEGHREIIIENYKKRLKGERFSASYELIFVKKDGSIFWSHCFTNTILYWGRYCGLILFYDITQRKQAENISKILIDINKIIINSLTEEEVYQGICRSLVENLGFKLVWIGMPQEGKIIHQYGYGDDQGFLKATDKIINEDRGIWQQALQTGEIQINSDLRNSLKIGSSASESINKGFLSSCTIPLKRHGKVVSLLEMYSEFPNFFNENIRNILEEIQSVLSFALERVERIKENLIISEALKNSDTWILVTDEKGQIVYVNEAVEKISGYKKEELLGENPRIFKSGLNPPEFYKDMWDTILSGKIFNAITPNRKKDGEIFHADLKIIPVRLPGDFLRFVAVAKDITEKLMLSEKINKLQNYDSLTDLLNLNGFSTEVSLGLQKTLSRHKIGIFMLIDIVNMTYINKILGVSCGDLILKNFGQKLKEIFYDTFNIARIGADTFGVYVEVESSSDLTNIYLRLMQLNDTKFKIDEKELSININAGISLFPKDGNTFMSLYEKADITLTKAKNEGAGAIKFFVSDIEKDIEKFWDIFNLIKRAFDENLFVFYYQPYLYTKSLEIAGYEALVRIIDKDSKVYYPNIFINHIENSTYLKLFEEWAVNESINQIKKWKSNISVNISGKTFSDPNFFKRLSQIPEEIRDKITIEITERVLIENPENALILLSKIKEMKKAPKIAIDDFGTGYSSLSYIKDLPIDVIKIDITFIREILRDKKSLAIVQTIIDLAKRLDKMTLAEGVENKEQFEILKSLQCDMVQGFLFAKPLSAKEIEENFMDNGKFPIFHTK